MGIYDDNRAYFEESRARPAALISRKTFRIERDKWAVNEVWDLEHPRCPEWMRTAYINPLYPRSRYPIQRIVTDEEFQAMGQIELNF